MLRLTSKEQPFKLEAGWIAIYFAPPQPLERKAEAAEAAQRPEPDERAVTLP
jgi:hypothetical protein